VRWSRLRTCPSWRKRHIDKHSGGRLGASKLGQDSLAKVRTFYFVKDRWEKEPKSCLGYHKDYAFVSVLMVAAYLHTAPACNAFPANLFAC